MFGSSSTLFSHIMLQLHSRRLFCSSLVSEKCLQSLPKHAHAINRKKLVVKMKNFAGKNDIFLIFAQNIDCGYTLEPPRRGGSNEYPQSMF